MMENVNYLAILVASIAGFAAGMLWHGPVFGKLWMRLSKISMKDRKKMRLTAGQAMTMGFGSLLVTSFALSLLLGYAGIASVGSAACFAVVLWIAASLPVVLSGFLWENKPFALVAFNSAYRLVELLVMVSVLTAMA